MIDNLPEEFIETQTAKIWLDDEGIINLVIKGKQQEGLKNSQENWEAVNRIRQGKVRPIFVDIRNVKFIDQEGRKFYAREEGKDLVNAVAFMVDSPLSRIIGSLFIGLNRLPVPVRLFASEEQALAWLREFIE